MKNSIMYKLAIQVSDFYLSALNKTNKSNAIRSEWIEHVACKKYHFEAAAQYRCALYCLERGKYGEEVARLQAWRRSSVNWSDEFKICRGYSA